MSKFARFHILLPAIVSLPALGIGTASQAATIIPDKAGLSGYVNAGIGAVDIESNLLAGAARGIVDIGDEVIDDLYGSPGSDSAVIPMLNFELSYTFEESRTQLYIGNLLEDFLTFDLSGVAGIRQDVGGVGIFGLALVNTSLSTDVWEDPYQTGVRRDDTERTARGYRVSWERMFDSGMELQYSSKELEVDRERSGFGLGLSASERNLLDRNGDLNRLNVGYEFKLKEGRHILTPQLVYREANLDGDAMTRDGYGATINYIYTHNQRWRWVFNLAYQQFDYDDSNPVYQKKDEADSLGLSATAFYAGPFGWKPWALNVTAGYFEEDHDINFYDTSVAAVTVGLFRRF